MKKMYLITLCLCLAFDISDMYSQEVGIAKTAKETLEIGKIYNLKISPSTSDYSTPPVFLDFKIVTSIDGNLALFFETFAEETDFVLFNENGLALNPMSNNVISGNYRYGFWYGTAVRSNDLLWNPTVEKFKGSVTFILDAGTYYLRIMRFEKGLSAANLSLEFKDIGGNR